MKNTNKKSQVKYYRTNSFYVAAFLYVKGFTLVSIDKASGQRAYFVFEETPARETLMEHFNFAREDAPEVLVDFRKTVTAIRQLKEKLYQDKF